MAGKLFNVSTLKATLGAGAKVDKFTIEFGAPAGNGAFTLGEFGAVLCKSTTFPEMKLGNIDVYVQGRKLMIPGDVEFGNMWTLDFYQTADHKLRQMFIEWMTSIDNYEENKHTCNPADWMVEAVVMQLDCDGNPIAKYRFFNLFPNDIADVNVDASQLNSIQEFRVSFHYSHWLVEKI